jgi:predicted nucleic acid-binding protein
VLRRGLTDDKIRLPHQAIGEFVSAATRPLEDGRPLLAPDEGRREAVELLTEFVVLYPTESLLRRAIRGWAAYQLAWFDAHVWAYAEEYGLDELISEDFQHDRVYGTVRAINPFL